MGTRSGSICCIHWQVLRGLMSEGHPIGGRRRRRPMCPICCKNASFGAGILWHGLHLYLHLNLGTCSMWRSSGMQYQQMLAVCMCIRGLYMASCPGVVCQVPKALRLLGVNGAQAHARAAWDLSHAHAKVPAPSSALRISGPLELGSPERIRARWQIFRWLIS